VHVRHRAKNPPDFRNRNYSGFVFVEITATLLLRFVPAEGTESVGANDLGADTIEVSGKRGVASGPPQDK